MVRPWSLLTILNFSARRLTDTTLFYNVSTPSSRRDSNVNKVLKTKCLHGLQWTKFPWYCCLNQQNLKLHSPVLLKRIPHKFCYIRYDHFIKMDLKILKCFNFCLPAIIYYLLKNLKNETHFRFILKNWIGQVII